MIDEDKITFGVKLNFYSLISLFKNVFFVKKKKDD